MSHSRFRHRIVIYFLMTTVCVCFMAASAALGCDTPVFQYALENWPADPYELILVQHGELPDEAAEAASQLAEGAAAANVRLHRVDVSASQGAGAEQASRMSEQLADWLRADPPASYPWLIVRYPISAGRSSALWSGALGPQEVKAWLDSAVRRRIADSLTGGSSGVWLMVESGDRARDDRSAQLLSDELGRLSRTMRLSTEGSEVGVGISFEVIRLARGNAAEGPLLRMLLGSEPDLMQFEDQPIVFPIYGRGLVLYALIGAGINDRTISEAAGFLVGPCSCQIKSQNPGLDLLITAAWPSVPTSGGSGSGALVGVAGFAAQADEARRALTASAEDDASAELSTVAEGDDTAAGWGGFLLPAIVGAALLLGAALLCGLRCGRGRRRNCDAR